MTIDYPAAPWHLQGFSLQSLHLLDVERVRGEIPSELKIISVLPGKTLGGLYVASYRAGSILEYNELIVVSAGVYRAGQVGGWISHIYVDHPESVAGGREIWGLPKQMAQFTWNHDASSVSVTQDNQLLCVLKRQWQLPGWRQSFTVPVFSRLDAKLQRFEGEGQFQLHLAGVAVEIPDASPLAKLDVGEPWLGFYGSPIHLTVRAPVVC